LVAGKIVIPKKIALGGCSIFFLSLANWMELFGSWIAFVYSKIDRLGA
jgi:hypothetical protein